MRWLSVLAFLMFVANAPAHAESMEDLYAPSSTIPGCLNDWSALQMGNTCEAKVARATWEERQSAVTMAVSAIVSASRAPDRVAEGDVLNALKALAAAADAARSAYLAPARGVDQLARFFHTARVDSENWTLPMPVLYGDVFRSLAVALQKPATLRSEKATLYDRAARLALLLNEIIGVTINEAVQQVETATLQAHLAARQADNAVRAGGTRGNADAAITAAAENHPDIAQAQITQLNQSLAAHPDQGRYANRVARNLRDLFSLWTIVSFGLGVVGSTVLTVVMYGAVFSVLMTVRIKAPLPFLVMMWRRQLVALPVSWLLLTPVGALAAGSLDGWPSVIIWLGVFGILMAGLPRLMPKRLRAWWEARELGNAPRGAEEFRSHTGTHGTASFGNVQAAIAGHHLAPSAPDDAFTLGWLAVAQAGVPDARFRQGGHILTCAPTGAGKGVGAVIPNLLDYPGSAFVLDFKGENYAVTARARRQAGHAVFLIDPFGITGGERHAMNWLDALNPEDPDVVAQAGALCEMLVVSAGREPDPHWNEAAKELLRGLLIYVAGLDGERRSMAEVRRIVTLAEADMAEVLGDMIADPARGHRIVARAATAHINRPDRERGSVLSTLVRHTNWLDDPRLEAAFTKSDFDLRDLKRRRMTVYIALPPDRLRACLGFLRGFIGLALNAMTAVPGKPAARVAFFLDEFGQLGRMDSLVDNITILRGYGAQFWLFVQDLSQLKAVYPRWQSFIANTTLQVFGTADYDTAKYISDTLGQYTITFQTSSEASQMGRFGQSLSQGEHRQGRALLTPDEVLRLGPEKPIVMPSGEAPYLLERINYLTDSRYVGRFDENPMHVGEVV